MSDHGIDGAKLMAGVNMRRLMNQAMNIYALALTITTDEAHSEHATGLLLRELGTMATLAPRSARLRDTLERWCGKVEHLSISEQDLIHGRGWFAHVLPKMTRLSGLKLRNVQSIDEESARQAISRLTGIRELTVSNCAFASDKFVKSLAPILTSLTSLDLSRCNAITSDAVSALVLRNADTLTNLNLSGI